MRSRGLHFSVMAEQGSYPFAQTVKACTDNLACALTHARGSVP